MTTQNFFATKKSFGFFTFRYKSASLYFNTFLYKLLFVLLLLFITVAAAYTQDVSSEDRNKDGKPDRWIEHYGT
jgi:hypothetical protein